MALKSGEIKRITYVNQKVKEIRELLDRYLPEKASRYEFEDIYNQLKELIC